MTRAQLALWVVFGASLVVCGHGWFAHPQAIAGGYLSAWSAVWTLAVGGLVFEMVGRVSGARFALTLSPLTSVLQRLLPIAALLYLPLLLGAEYVYPWIEGGLRVPEEASQAFDKVSGWYDMFGLGSTGLVVRSSLYFFVVLVLWRLLRGHRFKPGRVSGMGLFLLGVMWTFATTDWWMAQRTSWVSTIYPVIKLSGGFCAAVAATALYLCVTCERKSESQENLRHTVGLLLFAGSCFWAYLVYCQTLLIWIADLPHENGYLLARLHSGYWQLSIAVTALRFVIPFFVLLREDAKQNRWTLGLASVAMLLGHGLDEVLAVLPEQPTSALSSPYLLPSWLLVLSAGVACSLSAKGLASTPSESESKAKKQEAQRYVGEIECAALPPKSKPQVTTHQADDALHSRRIAQVCAGALTVGAIAVAFSASWLDGGERGAPHSPSGPLQTSLYNGARDRTVRTIPDDLRQRLKEQRAGLLAIPPDSRWAWLEGSRSDE